MKGHEIAAEELLDVALDIFEYDSDTNRRPNQSRLRRSLPMDRSPEDIHRCLRQLESDAKTAEAHDSDEFV